MLASAARLVRRHGGLVALVALFLALVLLRAQIVRDLKLDLGEAMANRLYAGWIYDAAAVITVGLVAVVLLAARRSPLWAMPVGILLFAAALANTLHFRFFGMRLDWWVVKLHWRDLGEIGGSATDLGLTLPVVGALLLLVLSLVLAVLGRHPASWWPAVTEAAPAPTGWRPRARLVLLLGRTSFVFMVLTFLLWRLPQWIDSQQPSVIVSDQIVRVWWYEWTRDKLYRIEGGHWMDVVSQAKATGSHPLAPLVRYRDHGLDVATLASDATLGTATQPAAAALPTADDARDILEPPVLGLTAPSADWPLAVDLPADRELTGKLRDRLALPRDGPIHVVLLLVESWRALEFDHPQIGPAVFPRLQALLRDHAIYFRQAYSSSLTAGQSVRGQFSTLCSMLPNIAGAAEYLAHSTVRVHCLQELFHRQHYVTGWFSAYPSTFHGGRQFESIHGTSNFYDLDHFREHGITETLSGGWGLADGPVLLEALRVIAEHVESGKSVFANIMTLSTHHPHSVVPDGPLPEWLRTATAEAPDYQGYLSRLSYADHAIADFVDRLLASPFGDRVLLVMLGDHSLPLLPQLELTEVQTIEMRFRIPLALVTRGLRPSVVHHPVHQADVAPTIARVAGYAAPVSWVGRGLLAPRGSPWLYQVEDSVSYRTAERACYSWPPEAKPRCYDTRDKDPLRDLDLVEIPEVPEQTQLARDIITADLMAVALNRIVPPFDTRASHAPQGERR